MLDCSRCDCVELEVCAPIAGVAPSTLLRQLIGSSDRLVMQRNDDCRLLTELMGRIQ